MTPKTVTLPWMTPTVNNMAHLPPALSSLNWRPGNPRQRTRTSRSGSVSEQGSPTCTRRISEGTEEKEIGKRPTDGKTICHCQPIFVLFMKIIMQITTVWADRVKCSCRSKAWAVNEWRRPIGGDAWRSTRRHFPVSERDNILQLPITGERPVFCQLAKMRP